MTKKTTRKQRKSTGAPISRRTFTAGAAAVTAVSTFSIPRYSHGAAPLKIGCLQPTSGFFANEGQNMVAGIEIAKDILPGMGHNIEVIYADTESNADKARTAAEKLINDGAQVLTGAFVSGHTIAVAQVAEQRGIPLIINIAAANQITEQGYKYVVRNFPTGKMIVGNGLKAFKAILKEAGAAPKSAVVMYANDTFGKQVGPIVAKLIPKFGLPFKVLDVIPYDPKARDLSVEVAKAKATNAEILVPVTHGTDAIKLVREMVKGRWEPTAILNPGAPGMYDKQFIDSLGKYSEYMVQTVPWVNPNTEMSKKLIGALKKRYPDKLFQLNVGAKFEAILIAAEAYKRAGTSKPAELMAAIKQTNITDHVLVGGPIQFNEKGQNVNVGAATVQNLNRKPSVVLPKEAAEAKLVFPMPGWNDKRRV